MMKKIILVMIVMALVVSVSGCIGTGEPAIKSQEEVSSTIGDIGSDIEKVTTDIESIDESLGGS